MPTTPPSTTAAPTQLPQRKVKDTFNTLIDAFVTWFATKAAIEIPALAANVFANATEAFQSATTASNAATTATDAAAAAVATANATLWVSGATVQQRANVISPLDHQTYRRKTATGSGTTDPSLDTANYVLVSVGTSACFLLGSATVSSAVANIDFLNLFSDLYTKYVIEIAGLTPSANDALCLQLASGGVVSTSNIYASGGNPMNFDTGYVLLSSAGTGESTLTVEVRGARAAIARKGIRATGISHSSTGIRTVAYEGGWANSAVASGFRLLNSMGTTFTAGTVRVYGIRA